MRFAGVISIRPILLPLVVLIPLTLVPTLLGYTGLTYAVAALFLNASSVLDSSPDSRVIPCRYTLGKAYLRAKALIAVAFYGTTKAVPFVQSVFPQAI
jgi:hypothetical protein